MFKTCPHCQAALQPGEAQLGWCGECGNCFWKLPDHAAPLLPSEAPGRTPLAPEWRWVARGLLMKLAALLVGVGGVEAVAIAADWDFRLAFHAPNETGITILLAAATLDIVGRLLCLATPQAASRSLVIASVCCQFIAVLMELK